MSPRTQPAARTASAADLVRRVFRAYQTADRSAIEPLLTEDFTFTSPYDDHIDRATYFERCWPGAGAFERFELEQITVDGDACFAMYTGQRRGGNAFHNTERFELAGDRIRAVEVFFGLPPGAPPERPPALEIRHLLGRRERAMRHRDAAEIAAMYAHDATGFGLAPPLRVRAPELQDPSGLAAWFAGWTGPIEAELHELEIRAGGELGFATALQHLVATSTAGDCVDLWFRSTLCFCKEDGAWKIQSVHDSVPFAMDGSGRARADLRP
jgi:ketosteroid isomerase-like protein